MALIPIAIGTIALVISGLMCGTAFWIGRSKEVLETGQLTRLPPLLVRVIRVVMARMVLPLVVGRLTVLNPERLAESGQCLILPNHQFLQDALVMAAVLGLKPFRYMVLDSQILGLRAPFAALFGAIVLHPAQRFCGAARLALKSLQDEPESSLLMFPQGRRMHAKPLDREDFAGGALRIGCHLAKKKGRSVAALPVGIHYDRDPSHATLIRRILGRLGCEPMIANWFSDPIFGVTVAIGEPIWFADLPQAEEGELLIFQRIKELCLAAQADCVSRY